MNNFESPKNTYVIVWVYHLKKGQQGAFENAYGPQGGWVQLFKQSKGYLGTHLHQDMHNPLIYMTLDYWKSEQDYLVFGKEHYHEYMQMDGKFEALTESEEMIGAFERLAQMI